MLPPPSSNVLSATRQPMLYVGAGRGRPPPVVCEPAAGTAGADAARGAAAAKAPPVVAWVAGGASNRARNRWGRIGGCGELLCCEVRREGGAAAGEGRRAGCVWAIGDAGAGCGVQKTGGVGGVRRGEGRDGGGGGAGGGRHVGGGVWRDGRGGSSSGEDVGGVAPHRGVDGGRLFRLRQQQGGTGEGRDVS